MTVYLDTATELLREYNRRESEAIALTPVYLARAFSPMTFNAYNFSTRIESENELWRFFDSQQEFRTRHYLQTVLGDKIKTSELEMLDSVWRKYSTLYDSFSRPTHPFGVNAALSLVATVRTLHSLKRPDEPLSILEIGGGSGLLGHMCSHNGWTYTNFDITQSFCVHNMAANEVLYGSDFFSGTNLDIENINRKALIDKQRSVNFIPWWIFTNLQFDLPKYDVVIMNHCFFEIGKKAMMFILSRLSDSSDSRQKLLVSGWGSRKFTELTPDVCSHLEKEFDFQMEPLRMPRAEIPLGTVLTSFKRDVDVVAGDQFGLKIDQRSSYVVQSDKAPVSKGDLSQVMEKAIHNLPSGKKLLKILKNDYIIGQKQPLCVPAVADHAPDDEFRDATRHVFDLISAIENHNGKAAYTEDEATGFYIRSHSHD
jgi:methylase of polypeptide subunit release factors